jgi:hypothetical protein
MVKKLLAVLGFLGLLGLTVFASPALATDNNNDYDHCDRGNYESRRGGDWDDNNHTSWHDDEEEDKDWHYSDNNRNRDNWDNDHEDEEDKDWHQAYGGRDSSNHDNWDDEDEDDNNWNDDWDDNDENTTHTSVNLSNSANIQSYVIGLGLTGRNGGSANGQAWSSIVANTNYVLAGM